MLKKLFVVGFLVGGSIAAQGQAIPAYKAEPPVFVGVFFSGTHPDYGTNTIDGFGAYADLPLWRFVGAEGEIRFGKFNTVDGVEESTYLGGPKVSYSIGHGIIPYGKFLVGGGTFNYPFKEGYDHHTVFAFGGGFDYRLTNHWYVRGDFEKQRWSFGNGAIWPSTLSAGVAYRFF